MRCLSLQLDTKPPRLFQLDPLFDLRVDAVRMQFEQLENTSSSGKSVVNLLQHPSNASSGHQIPLGMFLLVQSHTFGQKPKVLYHPNISTNDTNTTHLQDQSSSSSIPTSIRHLHRSLPVGYRSRYLGVCDSCH